jgi:3-oxoadipate enol-lactonase
MTVAVSVDGPVDAPAIVLVHAIGTSSALWLPQVPALANEFRVVRVDLPGHGGSKALSPGAGFADYADAVAAALTNHDVDRFVLVGMSFGAMVSMQIAGRHASRVDGLVLACCGARTPPPVAQAWRDRIAAVEAGGIATQVEGSLARWFTPEFAAGSPTTLGWVRSLICATPAEGFVAAAGIIADLDHLALLPGIDTPCLVVAGTRDQAAPAEAMRGIADAIPGARFETIEAAHLANVEAPVAFTETVGAFARSL